MISQNNTELEVKDKRYHDNFYIQKMLKLFILSVDNLPSFEESIVECRQYFELGVRSQFDVAIDKLNKWSSVSIYHACTQMNLSILRHMITLNKVFSISVTFHTMIKLIIRKM